MFNPDNLVDTMTIFNGLPPHTNDEGEPYYDHRHVTLAQKKQFLKAKQLIIYTNDQCIDDTCDSVKLRTEELELSLILGIIGDPLKPSFKKTREEFEFISDLLDNDLKEQYIIYKDAYVQKNILCDCENCI